MRPRTLILALLGALALGCAALALIGDPPPQPIDGSRSAPADPPADAAADHATGVVQADLGRGEPRDDDLGFDVDDEVGERTEVEISSGEPTAGPTILVVRGEPPTPLAGVEVRWVDRDVGREQRRALPAAAAAGLTDMDLPVRFGLGARTGSDGRLRLPPLTGSTVVTVDLADAGLFASRVVRPGDREYRLALVADEAVVVQVVGPDDAPRAGVPVTLTQGAGWNRSTRSIWRGATDAAGRAVARHFQLLRRSYDRERSDDRGGPANRFAASVSTPLPEPVAVEFAGEPAPDDPVVLRLPATAAVAFEVVHGSGPPLLSPVDIALVADRDGDPEFDLPLDRGFDTLRVDKPLGDEPVAVSHVGVGTRVVPQLRFAGQRREATLPALTVGPDTGDPAPIRLAVPDAYAVVAFTALQPDGGPLAGTRLWCTIEAATATLHRDRVTTLTDGRSDLVLLPRDDAIDAVLTLRLTLPDGVELGCERRLVGLRRGERRDLGECELQPLPPLATGRVVDDRGAPIAAARISTQRYVDDGRRQRWIDVRDLRTSSAADGTFAVFGAAPPGTVRLHASASRHFATESPAIAAGARVQLVLQREGQLRGQVLLADWMPRGAIDVRVVAAGDSERPQTTSVRARDGRFSVEDLRPGVFRVTAHMRNVPDPLAVVDGVTIAAGDNSDPRLLPLDLRAALHRYELRAIGDGGRHLAELDEPILWRSTQQDGGARYTTFRWQNGRAELLTPSSFLDLVTLARGYAPTEVSVGPGQHDIYLRKLHPAVVDLPGVRGVAGLERAIRVSMICTEETGLPQGARGVDQRTGRSYSFPRWQLGKSGGGWLDGGDRAAAELSRNGNYQVVLRLYAGAEQHGHQASMELGQLDVVLDGAAPQQHRMQVDLAEVQRLVEVLTAQERASAEQRAGQGRNPWPDGFRPPAPPPGLPQPGRDGPGRR